MFKLALKLTLITSLGFHSNLFNYSDFYDSSLAFKRTTTKKVPAFRDSLYFMVLKISCITSKASYV